MRVPERVDVAHRPQLVGRHAGHVLDLDAGGGVDVAGLPALNAGVAGLADQGRQPPHLQVQPDVHEGIGAVQGEDERRLCLDEVRVLVPVRQRGHLDPIAAHLSAQVGERFDAGHDAQLGLGGARPERGEAEGGQQREPKES